MDEARLFELKDRERPDRFNAASFEAALANIERVLGERYDRPSLVTKIACEIGAEIVEGLRSPGAELNSVELADRYDTSRTPIREALMLLEKEGLVEMLPRRRPRVAELAVEDIAEIYHVRAALFEIIAGEAAKKATTEDVANLRKLFGSMGNAAAEHDVDSYVWANVEFYAALSNASRNRTASRLIDSLLLRSLRLRRQSLSLPGRMTRSLKNHDQIVTAIEDGDDGLARALIRSNHINALKALQAAFSSAPLR